MLVFMAFFALASASAVKFERPEDVNEESGKLFFTSNNMGSFLAINSTVLVVGVVALLLVAVVAVLLLGGGGLSSGYSRYGNEYPHAHHEQAYYGDENLIYLHLIQELIYDRCVVGVSLLTAHINVLFFHVFPFQ